MQVINVTKTLLCSAAFTYPMLEELGVRYLGMTKEAVEKLSAQRLTKGSADMQALPFAKLRTVILNKLDTAASATPEQFGNWTEGTLQLEFACMPDLQDDIGKAGANTRKRSSGNAGEKTRKTPAHTGGVPRKGAYKVNRRTKDGSSTNGGDDGMWEIWQHIWNCTSFEEYFAKAPAKSTKKTGTVVTASGEMNYALKCGFIVPEPVAAEQEPAAAE